MRQRLGSLLELLSSELLHVLGVVVFGAAVLEAVSFGVAVFEWGAGGCVGAGCSGTRVGSVVRIACVIIKRRYALRGAGPNGGLVGRRRVDHVFQLFLLCSRFLVGWLQGDLL